MNKYVLFVFAILLVSCNATQEKETLKKEALFGYWSKKNPRIVNDLNDKGINDTIIEIKIEEFPKRYYPFGFAIDENKIDFFNAFGKKQKDSLTDKLIIKYFGNKASYKLTNDSLFIIKPNENKWTLLWKINEIQNDTLFVTLKNGKKRKYNRLKDYRLRNDFDAIVFSSTGCFGYCPILDIIINKNGKIIFKGEKYVNQIGYYTKQLGKEETKYIFDKFNRLDLNKLREGYSVSHSDDEAYCITLLKNGKIVKTITDYGLVAPRELFWCYDRIKNIHNKYKLNSLDNNMQSFPKLSYFAFKKDSGVLKLKNSESFYLWSELYKSHLSNKKFKAKYQFGFYDKEDVYYLDEKLERLKIKIDKIITDGRYYKIIYLNKKTITYDLGYNFIERNFKDDIFKKEM